MTYTVDNADRMTAISGTINSVTTPYATISNYLPYGPYPTVSMNNDLTTTITYDNQYRFDGQTIAGSQTIFQNDYTHDANGNITAITDLLNSAKNKTYGYGALNRLTSATGPWPSLASLSYTYDPVGNRLTEGGSLGSSTYSYIDNLLTGATGTKNLSFSYDAAGSTVGENNKTYIYNQNNRLIQVKENSNTLGTYVYDGQGRRVKKVANSQTTYYLYDQRSRLIAESDGIGDITMEYVYLPDRPLVKIDIGSSSEETYYYHTDHLGTPLFMSDESGQTVWSTELLPFGEGYAINEDVDGNQVNVVNNLRFPGQYYDAESGLYNNMERDYLPQTGRYIESDPLGLEAGINTYRYASNNPVNVIDPFGLNPAAAIGAGIGTAIQPGIGTAIGGAIGFGIGIIIGKEIIKEDDKCDNGPCPPCNPPVGTIGYRYDRVPPSKPHYPFKGDHVHLYEMNQNATNCQCFWKPIGVSEPPPPPGAIPLP